MKAFFTMTSKKRSSCVFLQTLGAVFRNETTLGAIFPGFCPDFQVFISDFRQIKTFGSALAPPAPLSATPLPLPTTDELSSC